nr:hypothetical protein [Tanacetum cinerariifolium]
DPTKVKIVERERVEDEPLLLQTTVGRTIPLLPVTPDRTDSELEISIDMLFDEGGSGSQARQGAKTSEEKENRSDGFSSFVPVMTAIIITTFMADPVVVVKEKTTKPSFFVAGSSFASGVDPNAGVFGSYRNMTNGSRLDDGRICHDMVDEFAPLKFFASDAQLKVVNDKFDKLYADFVEMSLHLEKSMTNGSRLDDGRICHDMVDEFAPLKFFASVWRMKHDQLFTKYNVRAARQISLSVEVRMYAEYNIREKRRLKSVVKEKDKLLKPKDKEIEILKAHMVLKEAEAAEAIRLRAKASNFVTMEKSFRDEPYLLTNIFGHRWLLTHGMELAITKCLHSPEYLSALETAIGKSIEKGMQDELFARIAHGAKGRVLTDVVAYNPSAEADYISALQHLQNVNFPLLAVLGSNKDDSVDTLINILRLEETLAKRLGLTELQPHVDQLMVPIHHSPDQVIVGASASSLALDVSSSWVWKIKENIVNHRSALPLRDVFVPLAEPLSATALTGIEGTSNVISATANTTTALSTTLAFASIVAPISVDDYEFTVTDDQAGADGNADPFSNVDDAELNIPL